MKTLSLQSFRCGLMGPYSPEYIEDGSFLHIPDVKTCHINGPSTNFRCLTWAFANLSLLFFNAFNMVVKFSPSAFTELVVLGHGLTVYASAPPGNFSFPIPLFTCDSICKRILYPFQTGKKTLIKPGDNLLLSAVIFGWYRRNVPMA